MKKKYSVIKLDFWYKDPKDTQPMVSTQWDDIDTAGILLMEGSNGVFSRAILDDKSMPEGIKTFLYYFCCRYVKEYEKRLSKKVIGSA